MLTNRPLLLTIAGLLAAFTAAGQSAAAPAAGGPSPTDILSWVAMALGAVVVLMGLITGSGMVAASAQARLAEEAAPAAAETLVPAAAAPALAPPPAPAAQAPREVALTEPAVLV